jgi:hypothetical protein
MVELAFILMISGLGLLGWSVYKHLRTRRMLDERYFVISPSRVPVYVGGVLILIGSVFLYVAVLQG